MIVLHYTAMTSTDGALKALCDPAREVSAHYAIAPDGTLYQLVQETARAWHAGAASWCGAADVNSRSIGIELCNAGTAPFAAAQMDALEQLLAGLMRRWSIAPERVTGHSDVAPGRKIDPGPRFDWRRLARQGLAMCAGPVAPRAPFRHLAQSAGYTADVPDPVLLDAIRLRHRPAARGQPLEHADLALLQGLVDAQAPAV